MMAMSGFNVVDKVLGGMVDGRLFSALKPSIYVCIECGQMESSGL